MMRDIVDNVIAPATIGSLIALAIWSLVPADPAPPKDCLIHLEQLRRAKMEVLQSIDATNPRNVQAVNIQLKRLMDKYDDLYSKCEENR